MNSVSSVNPKILSAKEFSKKTKGIIETEQNAINLKMSAIIVRVTKANIIGTENSRSRVTSAILCLCQKSKQKSYFKQPNLRAQVLMFIDFWD